MPLSTLSTSLRNDRLPAAARTAQPTRSEAAVFEWVNAARENPERFGRRIGVDLSRVRPMPPLEHDGRLTAAARDHALWMARSGSFRHVGTIGDPGEQMRACGITYLSWAQSIAAGYRSGIDAVEALVRDEFVRDQTHRRHVLGIGRIFRGQSLAGVGFFDGGAHGTYWVIDTIEPDQVDVAPAAAPSGGREVLSSVFVAAVGRVPTEGEWEVYSSALDHGVPTAEMYARVASTDEATGHMGSDVAWVRRLYRVMLGRVPTRKEVDRCVRVSSRAGRRAAADLIATEVNGKAVLAQPTRRAMMSSIG